MLSYFILLPTVCCVVCVYAIHKQQVMTNMVATVTLTLHAVVTTMLKRHLPILTQHYAAYAAPAAGTGYASYGGAGW